MRMAGIVLFVTILSNSGASQIQTNPVTMVLSNPKHRAECIYACSGRRALIFVHGLWGSEDTWKNATNGKTWPELISEDSFFDNFDVYVVSYPTSVILGREGNKVRLTQVSQGLYELLNQRIIHNYKTIHLIGHSMGGNVILTSVLLLKLSDPTAHSILTGYKNIILLSTPVEGADVANLALLVSSDQKLFALKPVVENELPVLIEFGFTDIFGKRLAMGLEPLRISAAYETKPYVIGGFLNTRSIIVSEQSATALRGHLVAEEGFDRDHSTIVKPKDRDDCVYQWVRQQIQNSLATEQ